MSDNQAQHAESVPRWWSEWVWFRCPECRAEWGSQQEEPDREWCGCNSAEFPVRIDRPTQTDGSGEPQVGGDSVGP